MFVITDKDSGKRYAWKPKSPSDPLPVKFQGKRVKLSKYRGPVTNVRSGSLLDKKIKGGAIDMLTEVQMRSLEPGLDGRDILAKSNTGSGKTLAFFIVAIERILRNGGPDPTTSFPIVVMTPVTDLAEQIMRVAKILIAHQPGFVATTAIGGTSTSADIAKLAMGNRVDILVATPGRLQDLLTTNHVADRMANVQTFIIDEADKMTDPGFLTPIRKIRAYIKSPSVQTLMFSATLDRDAIAKTNMMRPDFVYIDTAVANSGVAQVNTNVVKTVVITNTDDIFDTLVQSITSVATTKQTGGNFVRISNPSVRKYLSDGTKKALNEWETKSFNGFRIMVFIPANAMIDFVYKQFLKATDNKITAFRLHGGMPQKLRSAASDKFNSTDNAILFTSDASARGVDYKDVTSVVQLGFDSRAEYIQRVGRTGRTGGKDGRTVLIMTPYEAGCLEQIKDVVSEVYTTDGVNVNISLPVKPFREVPVSKSKRKSMSAGGSDAKNAFRGWLGWLASKWKSLKIPKEDVVKLATSMENAMGLPPMDISKIKSKLHIS